MWRDLPEQRPCGRREESSESFPLKVTGSPPRVVGHVAPASLPASLVTTLTPKATSLWGSVSPARPHVPRGHSWPLWSTAPSPAVPSSRMPSPPAESSWAPGRRAEVRPLRPVHRAEGCSAGQPRLSAGETEARADGRSQGLGLGLPVYLRSGHLCAHLSPRCWGRNWRRVTPRPSRARPPGFLRVTGAAVRPWGWGRPSEAHPGARALPV